MIRDELRQKILKKSIPLEKFGINDFSWEKIDAIEMINLIQNEKIGILGGDVYRLEKDRLISTYDNWFFEPEAEESINSFNLRSKKESIKYIENYPIEPGEKILFAIVFTEIFD